MEELLKALLDVYIPVLNAKCKKTFAFYPSKHPSPYWKAKFNEAYNGYGCFMFCDDRIKCKYRNKFDHRIKKAINLTI